jgi:hypothetical protein
VKKLLLTLIFLFLLFPSSVLATIGVGVGSGKIQVDEKLKPGVIYELPPLTVLNTGDEPSEYEVVVEYHEEQTQLWPSRDWFSFSPQKFSLEPGKSQVVKIKLNLPVMTKPGDYFAYLEGHPLKKSETGTTSIGVAAAAKLYFTIVPGNVFEGIYYKGLSTWKIYSPWPQAALVLMGLFLLVRVIRKFFNIEIKPRHRSSKHNGDLDKDSDIENDE